MNPFQLAQLAATLFASTIGSKGEPRVEWAVKNAKAIAAAFPEESTEKKKKSGESKTGESPVIPTDAGKE